MGDLGLKIMEEKTCSKCGKKKKLEDFYKRPTGRLGVTAHCKKCDNVRSRANYRKNPYECNQKAKEHNRKNPEQKKRQHKRYYEKHKDKINAKIAERNRKYPKRAKAISIVRSALMKGTLVRPSQCSKCDNKKNIQAHHEDYSKPLEIIWLCASCHAGLHWGGRRKHHPPERNSDR
jgi:hypothetical protein